jgi:DNA-binding ferritin-like protein
MDAPPIAPELQPLLVELTDLAFSAKQAHWNVVGPRWMFAAQKP